MRKVALFVYVAIPGMVAAQVGSPIETRNFRTLSLPFLRLTPRSGLLPLGEQSLSLGLTSANDVRGNSTTPGTVSEDCETTQLLARYRRGIGNGLDLAFDVPLVARGGGILDPIYEWWHRNIVHLTNTARESAPYGNSYVNVPGHDTFGSAAGLGDISATVTKSMGTATLISAAVKIPTGAAEKLIGSGAFDFGVAAQHTYQINKRWSVLGQLGYVIQGRATSLPNSRNTVNQQAISLMYSPNGRDTYVGQWQGEDSATITGDPRSDNQHRTVTLGYHRQLNKNQRLELFFTEDGDFLSGIAGVGPDFTIGARLTTRW